MAKVAKSNGIISTKEAEFISQRYAELAKLTNKTEDVIDIYEEIFQREKDRLDNLEEFARKLRALDEAPKAYILKILNQLSEVDGDRSVVDKIIELMNYKQPTSSDYYEILGVSVDDDWDTIKKKYKELVKQYHYDKLASKNLPPDLLQYAQERLKQINQAYDAIKKQRGM
ncbi:MAG: DnaJ domain-containing protein [Epsilonproteobacteria bacterium]|nr:DnaJ domain-containing protein [Campylobacterota bacterium]